MHLLRGAIRQYAWGSRTALAELTGRSVPSAQPEAEYWLGAHPTDPAWPVSEHGEQSLLDFLRGDTAVQLGDTISARYSGELPFLMKVIAADQPLSLQAHPNAVQARAGFEREQRTNRLVSAPDRNYRDPRHKPEIVVALEPFSALAGFRPVSRTRDLLRTFGIEDIDGGQELANACQSEALRALFTAWMTAPPPIVEAMVAVVLAGAERYLRSGAAEFAAEATTLVELAARYPGDSGVLAALLLNRISLAPGDALFLPAGNLHAYLRGVAVEVMANSDNVLRGGLTSKHVDVPELLHILDFNPVTHDQLRPVAHRDGPRVVYTPPVDEFAVSVWSLGDGYLGREVTALRDEHGPYILLCTQGCVAVRNAHTTFTLRRGQAAWVPAHDRPVCLYADQPATVFGAGVSPLAPMIGDL